MVWNLVTKVRRAYLLESGQEIEFRQWYEIARDENRLAITIPEDLQIGLDCVIVLELENSPEFRELPQKTAI